MVSSDKKRRYSKDAICLLKRCIWQSRSLHPDISEEKPTDSICSKKVAEGEKNLIKKKKKPMSAMRSFIFFIFSPLSFGWLHFCFVSFPDLGRVSLNIQQLLKCYKN